MSCGPPRNRLGGVTYRAADAAVVHLEDVFSRVVPFLYESIVHAHLAKLVLDHRNLRSVRVGSSTRRQCHVRESGRPHLFAMLGGKDVIEQRRLPAAQKAGQDRDGHALVSHVELCASVSDKLRFRVVSGGFMSRPVQSGGSPADCPRPHTYV